MIKLEKILCSFISYINENSRDILLTFGEANNLFFNHLFDDDDDDDK